MLCQECGERPATVHVQKIANGQKTEMYLCEECARAKGELSFLIKPAFSINNLLGSLADVDVPGSYEKQSLKEERCPTCGFSYSDFARVGNLGCSECYNQFGGRINSLVRRIHGSDRHVGKVPKRAGGSLGLRREIEKLRNELDKSIRAEEYERAAGLRDKIRDLEKKLAQ